ncbi:MAG: DUF4239 domain-containing protein [Candidatus Melainabacteria bacterium]|jgi:hypothetical protein|nr:DUF4239 domain-containing protein [Candidatus Melainabacteria bacterium]OPZ88728.1 MAG: hypothetical protein BWY75_01476 [bacterium ADurb.Bin425]
MNSYLAGFLAVCLTTALSVAGMLYVRRKVSFEVLVSYHEVAGYLLSVVGTLYAVLLGFVVVDTMQHAQDLRVLVDQEASGLANIYLLANGLPEPKREKLKGLCVRYADEIVSEEWKAMEKGGYSVKAFSSVWAIWKEITSIKPGEEDEKALHQELISQVCEMTQNRRTRIISAAHGVSPLLWVVLIVGGSFTVIFTYFFAVEHLKAQVIMTILVALTLALNIFLVFVFSSPFSGDFAVKPDSFRLDRMIFRYYDKGEPPPPEVMHNQF